jgi:hypothetical protein
MMASVAGPGRSDPENPFPPTTMDSLPTFALTTWARGETSSRLHQLCPSAALRRILIPSSRGLDETQPCLPRPPLEFFGGDSCAVPALADCRPPPTRAPARFEGPGEATKCSLSIGASSAREIATDQSMRVEFARKDAREVPPQVNRQAPLVAHPNARTRRGRYLRPKWPRRSESRAGQDRSPGGAREPGRRRECSAGVASPGKVSAVRVALSDASPAAASRYPSCPPMAAPQRSLPRGSDERLG